MALSPGARLGPYAIIGLLGQGGMGEVYRARDSRLDRDVAIKILPAAVAASDDRAARFEREARTLGSLNHPNIGAIHGLEESGGTLALVLELVEGPTLADRLSHGAIPLAEALPIATQIADALEAAPVRGAVLRGERRIIPDRLTNPGRRRYETAFIAPIVLIVVTPPTGPRRLYRSSLTPAPSV